MNLTEIQAEITALNEALIGKGYAVPNCDLTIEGSGDAIVWVKTSKEGEIRGIFKNVHGDSLEAVFSNAKKYVSDLEDVITYKKKEAVAQFGRAIDALRGAEIEADFVDPLAQSLQAMTENLLTYEGPEK